MTDILLIVAILLLVGVLIAQVLLLKRDNQTSSLELQGRLDGFEKGLSRTEQVVREEVGKNREETSKGAGQQREELSKVIKNFTDSVGQRLTDAAMLEKTERGKFSDQLGKLTQTNEQKLGEIRQEASTSAKQLREEVSKALTNVGESLVKQINEMANGQKTQLEGMSTRLASLTASNETKLEAMRGAVETKLTQIQTDNATKLDQMRATVDEKLQKTLETRLSESFKLVSDRLEQVHKGLGEMQTLASGVGDLKKVLSNVKTRGTWGEVQLGNLLEQVLTPDQYATNQVTKMGGTEPVEYALRLPGRDDGGGEVWLPIDAKFPQEDYLRLVEAQEKGDVLAADEASKQLEARIRGMAKNIKDKYLDPPHTTDFGIMYLPTEGLYAEVIRRPGLLDALQREHRVNVTCPTTLAALLNSLQMGFRTLAITKQASEVWKVLGAVKTEFGKFGDTLDKVHKQLETASNTIDTAARKSRTIQRKLKTVEALPVEEAQGMLLLSAEDDADEPDLGAQP